MKCIDCKYFIPKTSWQDKEGTKGACHCKAPSPAMNANIDACFWPTVNRFDFCGEFKKKGKNDSAKTKK